MHIRPEVIPFIAGSLVMGILLAVSLRRLLKSWRVAVKLGAGIAIILCAYFLYFFRDPNRQPPTDSAAIVAGADGTVAAITELREDEYLKTNCVRISIFLSLFDVHVNRAPIAGKSSFLGYFPGKRFFTFQDKSSDLNQHNKILIEGEHTRCLVNQIVGPVCRRVVYWLDHEKAVDVRMGERIGMMKFGSRLDMYFPKQNVAIRIRKGDKVSAGETVVGHVTTENKQNKQ